MMRKKGARGGVDSDDDGDALCQIGLCSGGEALCLGSMSLKTEAPVL